MVLSVLIVVNLYKGGDMHSKIIFETRAIISVCGFLILSFFFTSCEKNNDSSTSDSSGTWYIQDGGTVTESDQAYSSN